MILNPLVLRLFYTRFKILNQAIQRFLGLQGLKDYQKFFFAKHSGYFQRIYVFFHNKKYINIKGKIPR